jgi:hypothetical protein
MYTSHPPENELRGVRPQHLADAPRHVHQISYISLIDIHDTISGIATVVNHLDPDYVAFFATGGIPICVPVMRHLNDAGCRRLVAGDVFHMFPGLAWEGVIKGVSAADYFSREMGMLIAGLSHARAATIVVIDTTNSGNAVNLAVKGVVDAATEGGAGPINLYVIGVVNRDRAQAQPPEGRCEVTSQKGNVNIITPALWMPEGALREREFARFASIAGYSSVTVQISYWIVDKLFTEDKAELIGAAAIRESLGIEADDTAGRLEINFPSGRTIMGTGLDTVGKRLINLLANRRDSLGWRCLERTNSLPPVAEEDQEFGQESRYWSEGGLRLIEMNEDPTATLTYLLGKPGLLTGVEIYWLRVQVPFPEVAVPKVVAAMRRAAPDDELNVEAIAFLRKAFPQATAPETSNVREWWLNRIDKLR